MLCLSLIHIFTRQGARDAIKHGETTLKELEAKVGFAGRYRRVQEKPVSYTHLDVYKRQAMNRAKISFRGTVMNAYLKVVTRALVTLASEKAVT